MEFTSASSKGGSQRSLFSSSRAARMACSDILRARIVPASDARLLFLLPDSYFPVETALVTAPVVAASLKRFRSHVGMLARLRMEPCSASATKVLGLPAISFAARVQR